MVGNGVLWEMAVVIAADENWRGKAEELTM